MIYSERIHRYGNRKWKYCRRKWRVLQCLPKSNTRKATKHVQHIRDVFANHFEDLARFPGNGKWFKNTRKYDFLCSNTFLFYYTLGVFKHKKDIQNDKIESFFSIQMTQMNCYNFVGNLKLKVETVGMQMKALNFVA